MRVSLTLLLVPIVGGAALHVVERFAMEALKNGDGTPKTAKLLHELAASLAVDIVDGNTKDVNQIKNEDKPPDPLEPSEYKAETSLALVTTNGSYDAHGETSRDNIGIHPRNLRIVKLVISFVPFNRRITSVAQGGVRRISNGLQVGQDDIHKALVILSDLPLLRTQCAYRIFSSPIHG